MSGPRSPRARAFVVLGLLAALAAPLGVYGGLVGAVAPHAAGPVPAGAAGPAFSGGTPQSWTQSSSSWTNSTSQELGTGLVSSSFSSSSYVVRAVNVSATEVQIASWSNSTSWSVTTTCTPNCSAPSFEAWGNSSSSDTAATLENLTSQASVVANGSTYSALGVLGASASSTLLETDSSATAGTPPAGLPAANLTGSFSVWSNATGSIAFGGPGLGLIPWTQGPADPAWNSTAGFTASISSTLRYAASGPFADLGGVSPAPQPGCAGNGTSAGCGGVGPIGLPYAGAGGSIFLCPGNSSYSGSNSSLDLSCAFQGPGNETAFGENLSAWASYVGSVGGGYYNNSSGNPPLPGPGPCAGPYCNATVVLLVATGPYLPSPALGSSLLGSAFFGGAVRDWTLVGSGPGIGYPGSGGSGSPSGPPPLPPYSGPPPVPPADPGTTKDASTPALDPPMMLPVLLLVGLLAALVAVVAVAVHRSRRARRPPTAA